MRRLSENERGWLIMASVAGLVASFQGAWPWPAAGLSGLCSVVCIVGGARFDLGRWFYPVMFLGVSSAVCALFTVARVVIR